MKHLFRKENPLGRSVVILAESDQFTFEQKMFCHLWFEDQDTAVVSAVVDVVKGCVYDQPQANYCPHMFSCKIPENYSSKIPVSVSLVKKECEDATNSLRVQFSPLEAGRTKDPIAVCLKG